MSTQVQRRKGTTAQHASFTGASAELTVDTTKNTVVVHDGATAGGIPLAKETGSAISATTLTLSGGTANGVPYLNGSKQVTTGTALTFDGSYFSAASGTGSFLADILQVSGNATKVNANGVGLEFRGSATPNITAFNRVTSAYLPMLLDTSASIFNISGSEGMRLTSTGLGIGTSSPSAKLHVSTTGDTQTKVTSGATKLAWTTYSNGTQSTNVGQENSTGGSLASGTSAYASVFGTNSAYSIQFVTSNLVRATIDSSGNLGIGTSSPSTKLHISTDGTYDPLRLQSTTTGFTQSWTIGPNVGTNGVFAIRDTVAAANRLVIDSSGNLGIGTSSPGAKLDVSAGNVFLTQDYEIQWKAGAVIRAAIRGTSADSLNFYTRVGGTITETMRLDASGNVLVGTTSAIGGAGERVHISGANIAGTQYGLIVGGGTSTSYALRNYWTGASPGVVGSVSFTAVATLFNTTSDQRLKENIVDAPEFGGVIDSLQVRSFDWKANQTHQRAGFIAQELVQVAPEAVHQPTNPEEMMAVDYSKLVPMLVKEIQDLRKRLAAANI